MKSYRDQYLEKGFCILTDRDVNFIIEIAKDTLGCSDLSLAHESIEVNTLNFKRLELSKELSSLDIKRKIFELLESEITNLAGSELSVQRNTNVTLHFPDLENNITPFHSDVLCGNSPYEVVVWIPLCDTSKTQSMYLFNKEVTKNIINEISEKSTRLKLIEKYRDQKEYMNLKKGEVLIFSPTLIHGSEVNLEKVSRVSLNLRFKNLHSPCLLKKDGEYFEDLTPSIQTIIAREYESDF